MTGVDGKFSVLIVSSDQNPLTTQFYRPQFETNDDSQHFERSDGQQGCVNERWIRGVEEMAVEKTANAGYAGVGAETNSRIDPRKGT